MANVINLVKSGSLFHNDCAIYVLTFMRILVFSYCCQHLVLCMYDACCVHACHGLSVEVRRQPWVLGLLCTLFKAESLLLYFLFCLLYVWDYLTHELLGILFSLPCISKSCVDYSTPITSSGFHMTSEDSNSAPHACVANFHLLSLSLS